MKMKIKNQNLPAWAGVVALVAATVALAQNLSVDWFKIAGGGGTSAGGAFSDSGTVGQPEAGAALTGGNFTLAGGYWAFLAAVPMPGAPLLTIALTATNTVAISWRSPSTGFVLQQNANGLSVAG